jgi:hypothetical protein
LATLLAAGCPVLLSMPLVVPLTGCQSSGEAGSASFASVTISNRTETEIAAATSKVFSAEGYRGGQVGGGKMVFEKEASRATTLSRDGLASTMAGARTVNRVRLEVVALAQGSHRLQCQAFVVTNPDDAFFADEQRLTRLRRAPYQALLDKIADSLK